MRIVFAGTPEFAARALDALVAAGHEVALVLTQPDRPAGRGRQAVPGAVKRAALSLGLAVEQPQTLRDGPVQRRLADCRADAMVVAAYGLILPPAVLGLFVHGCLNIHASLLPRWRGAAPIQRAIEAGDARTGITIMRMDAGLDTGPMLLAEATDIAGDDTAATLHDRLAAIGARLIVQALDGLAAGSLPETDQPADGVTYARKLDRAEAPIDWRLPAEAIERCIRAFDPVPGATATLASRPEAVLKVWRARVVAPGFSAGAGAAAEAGTVVTSPDGALVVQCGRDALALDVLQKPGGRRLPVDEFLRGFPVAAGERFVVGAT